ncbi:MAG: response regulator [Candidatus Omnitrophota bacterium]
MERKTEVMVVDDEHDFRELMTIWLKSKGYSVVTASNGETAIRMVNEHRPDIIFLDLNMPVLNGIQTLAGIRKTDKTLPVIIISAYLEQMSAQEAKDYNVSGVFYKGEDFEKGLALLESALRGHKDLKEKG